MNSTPLIWSLEDRAISIDRFKMIVGFTGKRCPEHLRIWENIQLWTENGKLFAKLTRHSWQKQSLINYEDLNYIKRIIEIKKYNKSHLTLIVEINEI